MWAEIFPTEVIIKDCQHLWVLPAGKLFSFTTLTQVVKIPFHTLTGNKLAVCAKVENGGIIARILDSSGNKEAEEYIEGEGASTNLQIEIETITTAGLLRYLEVEGIPDSGFTCNVYDLIALGIKQGGGWREENV